MKTFTSDTFECVFCGYSSRVTVRARVDTAVGRALAATRCPHCHKRFARGPWFAAFAALGTGLVAGFLTLAMLLRFAVGTHHRNPQIASWAGNWIFGVAIGVGAAVALASFVRQWRELGGVAFAKLPELPLAIARTRRG
jgi:hypothetical protein